MTDDAPTLPLPAAGPVPPPESPRPRRSATAALFAILSILVVAAIAVLVIVLVSRGSAAPPSAQPGALGSATDTAGPSSTTAQAPPASAPAAPAPTFTQLQADTVQRGCDNGHRGRGHGGGDHNPTIRVSWATDDASAVWIAKGTADAADAGTTRLPTSGNEGDFPAPLTFDCSDRSETFTMTLVGASGQHVSQSWTVQNRRGGF